VLDRPHAGERALNDDIAFARHDDALLRYDEAVDLAAAEFAVGVTKKAARNPTVVGKCHRAKG